MNVYKTVLYTSLEEPLKKVVIWNPFIDKALWEGDFQNIPKNLLDREVKTRYYNNKMLKLEVRA